MIRLLLAVLLLAPPAVEAQGAAEGKPNIVFILADDLGVSDLSCYGRAEQPTPHLDRLATEGARFTSAYCAQPICSPSRAAILTGKAPARLRLTNFLPGRADAPSQLLLNAPCPPGLPLEEVTLAERLKAAGYATACVGKWHLGNKGLLPTDQGFDVHHPGQANTKPTDVEGSKGEMDLAAAAERFLEAKKDVPFFLYLAHNTPHIPFDSRPDLVEKHKAAFNPAYAGVIETMDASVGRVLAKLDALGLREKTLVVFTSDNGGLHVPEGARTPATRNAPFRAGKGYVYEGGLRIPLLVRWPGRIPAAVIDTPVINTDWTPTFLELAGLKTSDAFDGQSIANVLRGEAAPARAFFWHYPQYTNQGGRPAGAVREGDWKLIEHYEDGRLELFNLAKDVGETADLAAQEPARVAALRGKLEAWRRAVNAEGNRANPSFHAPAAKALYRDVDSTRLAEPTAAAAAEKYEAWRKGMSQAPKSPPGAGALILHARDAKVTGQKLQYESPPPKDTLGFWVNPADFAEWAFDVPNAGTYEVEVLQGCGKGSGGAEVELAFAGGAVTFTVEETGHFQRFVPRTVGTVKLEKGPQTLKLSARSKPGPAVMDLRRVTLIAVP